MPGITMTGTRPRQTSFSSNPDSHYGAGLQGQVQPAAKVLVDGYTRSSESLGGKHQRYNSVRISSLPPIPRTLMLYR